MPPFRKVSLRGFTLIELLVVISIIAVLASIVMMSVSDSRRSGRDAARKVEIQEIIKALELSYSESGVYPTIAAGGVFLTDAGLQGQIVGSASNKYLKRVPDEPDHYYFCTSSDKKSMMIALNTERDNGGSNYCKVTRGPGSGADGYGCTAWMTANAADSCSTRL